MSDIALAFAPSTEPAAQFTDPSPEAIAKTLGGARRNGAGWTCYCPVHEADGRRHSPSFSVSLGRNGRNVYKCFSGCSQADILRAIRQRLGAGVVERDARPRPSSQRHADEHAHADRMRSLALAIWRETVMVAGTFTDLWLQERGIRFAIPPVIRHHPALPYWEGGKEIARFPAMVVRMDDPAGNFSGVHRTWLDGTIDPNPMSKAPVVEPRMMFGNAGVAWFGRRDASLIIAGEGVETVLAASELPEAYALTPVCCFNAEGMKAFDPPATVKRLWICEDADQAGRAATATLAARAHSRGIAAKIIGIA